MAKNIIIVALAMLLLASCVASPPASQAGASQGDSSTVPITTEAVKRSTRLSDEEAQELTDSLVEYLPNGAFWDDKEYMKSSDGFLDVKFFLHNYDDIANFGTRISTLKAAFENVTDTYKKLTIIATDSRSDFIFIFSTDGGATKYGELVDYRSGSAIVKEITSKDDLEEMFFTVSVQTGKDALNPADVKIYEEVWAVLEEQYWREEGEIFEELAPQYEMTATELKQFMTDMTQAIY